MTDADFLRNCHKTIDELRTQVKVKDDTITEHLAELRAKADTIVQLESSARDNRKTIDRMDKEADLYERIIDGLRAEVEMKAIHEKASSPKTSQFLATAAAGFLGNMFGGLVTDAIRKGKPDANRD